MFSTKNAPKITTATLATFNSTNFKVHEVPVKKQSVDMHLVTFLGYLIGKEGDSSNYVIISKDNDYQNIVKYWKNEINITVTYQDNFISNNSNFNIFSEERSRKRKSISVNSIENLTSNSPTSNSNRELNNLKTAIRNELKQLGCSNNNINLILKIVSTHYGNDKFLMIIHNEFQKSFDDYLTIYDVVKHVVSSSPSNTSNLLSPAVLQSLVFKTNFLFQRNGFYKLDSKQIFENAVENELKYFGYTKQEISSVVGNLINITNLDKVGYFNNLANKLTMLFEINKASEIFNIIKAMVLGDLIYPRIVIMTLPNGKYFSKTSPTLEIRKILNPVYNRVQEALYRQVPCNVEDKVCAIVVNNYLKDDPKQLIYKDIVSSFGQDMGLELYYRIKDQL